MGRSFQWKHQHTALAVVFTVWIVSYMDRMVMATAIPYIAKEWGLSPVAMGGVLSAFFAGYFIFQIPGGILADKFGARKVMSVAVLWWSGFTALTGLVGSLGHMLWIRFVFGVGEGVAPASTWKALANWSPVRKRGVANGIMMASNSLGPALAPLFVAAVMAAWGWRAVFYSLLIPGVLLAAWIWRSLPDDPADKRGISPAELEEIREDRSQLGTVNTAEAMSFWAILKEPAVWKSFLILLFNNMTGWGFAQWLPSYLVKARGFSLAQMGIAASLPFFAGTIGFILGGWLSDVPFKYRRRVPLIAAQWICAVFLYLTYTATSTGRLVVYQILVGLFYYIAAGIVFALPMSAISKTIAGRAMGIVNTAGQFAGFISPIIIGFLVQLSGAGARSFDTAFMFLIATILLSSVCAMTFTQRKPERSIGPPAPGAAAGESLGSAGVSSSPERSVGR